MDPSAVPTLPAMISPPRFQTYLTRCHGNQAAALRLYAWNMELSSAYWGPLGILEVLLRNALHKQMTLRRQADWWADPRVYLQQRERDAMTRTVTKLVNAGNATPSSDDVVGASNFGFWVGLLDKGVPRDRHCDYHTVLWEPRLKHAFPNLGSIKRRQLHGDLDAIRKLRNRVAHHEPVFRTSDRNIQQIVDVVGYMDTGVADFIAGTHRVYEVFDREDDAIRDGKCVI